MELDDLKNTWEDINDQAKERQSLNLTIVEQATRTKYNSSLKKVAYPEMAGIVICIAAAVYIVLNFSKLGTPVLKGAGIVSILLLCMLSAISLISIRQLRMTGDLNKTYAETLKAFARQKIRFHQLQRINVTLSYLLMVTVIILFSKFFSGNDITGSKYFWIFSFTFGYIFLLFYSKWVSKFYKKSLSQAEELLQELAS